MAVHQLLLLSRWVPKCWSPPAVLPLLLEVTVQELALWDLALKTSPSLSARRCSGSSDHKKQAEKESEKV